MACKHQSGIRIRDVECVRETAKPGEDDTLVEDSECTDPRPGSKELCQSHEKCKESRATKNIDGIPKRMLRVIWYQTKRELLNNEFPVSRIERKPLFLFIIKSSTTLHVTM